MNGYICGLQSVSSGHVQFCCERGYRLEGTGIAVCDRQRGEWVPRDGAMCERKCLFKIYSFVSQDFGTIVAVVCENLQFVNAFNSYKRLNTNKPIKGVCSHGDVYA